MSDINSINIDLATKFRAEVEALQKTARAIMALDKAKLEDSGDKFLHIRAVRADHLAREVKTGKSQRS